MSNQVDRRDFLNGSIMAVETTLAAQKNGGGRNRTLNLLTKWSIKKIDETIKTRRALSELK